MTKNSKIGKPEIGSDCFGQNHESAQLQVNERALRNDFNLSRLPYFITAHDSGNRQRDIYFELSPDTDGEKAIWEVQHSRLGLPGSFDRDVWLGILEIINEATNGGNSGCPEFVDLGTLRGFLRRIGKSGNGGKDIAMLKEAIERMARTMCVSRKSYKCPTAGGYLGKVFQLIDGWGFIGEEDGKGRSHEINFVQINAYVRKNLDSGYIALLDVKYLRSLKTEIAKQLYQLLSYLFWKAASKDRNHCSLPWQHLANYLGITSWDSMSRAKKRLKPALDELVKREYLSSYAWDRDRIVFFAGKKYEEERTARGLTQQKTSSSKNGLLPLASRWACGYNPSKNELLQRNCSIEDLKTAAIAANIPINRIN